MNHLFLTTSVPSSDGMMPFQISSLRDNNTLSLTTPDGGQCIMDPIHALELASALIAHAERLTPDLTDVSLPLPAQQCELSRATLAGRTVPFLSLMRGGATQDVMEALALAFAMPFGLHYLFQSLGM